MAKEAMNVGMREEGREHVGVLLIHLFNEMPIEDEEQNESTCNGNEGARKGDSTNQLFKKFENM